jgi:hypothetical protein
MRADTVKESLQLFAIVALGTGLFGLWQGYRIRETLAAAVIFGVLIAGIASVGALAERRLIADSS